VALLCSCALKMALSQSLVDVGFLCHATCFEFLLFRAIDLFVPQQITTLALLGLQRWLSGFQLVDELGGVGAVVGAAKEMFEGHGRVDSKKAVIRDDCHFSGRH